MSMSLAETNLVHVYNLFFISFSPHHTQPASRKKNRQPHSYLSLFPTKTHEPDHFPPRCHRHWYPMPCHVQLPTTVKRCPFFFLEMISQAILHGSPFSHPRSCMCSQQPIFHSSLPSSTKAPVAHVLTSFLFHHYSKHMHSWAPSSVTQIPLHLCRVVLRPRQPILFLF